ncbi:hypothetical protein AVEN_56192-1 [Araneus ventricosus]|uniref:Uncharacterized protein n=1 Tax=Araneus ventricosus TaxID=182803 RepID=A0A4Y2UES7_ARAVE|nr:hypothetical protein AVEN_56192-1 [Araneus ventricosus]
MFEWCKILKQDKEYVKNEPHDRQPQTPITELNTILIGNGFVGKQKPLLKRVSGCFQRTLEKNVLTPKESMLKIGTYVFPKDRVRANICASKPELSEGFFRSEAIVLQIIFIRYIVDAAPKKKITTVLNPV